MWLIAQKNKDFLCERLAKGGDFCPSPQGYSLKSMCRKSRANPKNTVLVAIVNNPRNFNIIHREHWYHIPVKSAPSNINYLEILAFYQTGIFKEKRWQINYYSSVKNISVVKRIDLFPQEFEHPRAQDNYYRIDIEKTRKLSKPITSRIGRRIVFIPTTPEKFRIAEEINDLFATSPIEDKLYQTIKRNGIFPERQFYIGPRYHRYCLDFAIFCKKGNINVECDGVSHLGKETVVLDRIRNNYLASIGWVVLRFGSYEISQKANGCMNLIHSTIINQNGLKIR